MNSMFHSAFTYFSGVHAPVVSNVTNQSPVDDDVDKAMLLSTITQCTVWSITADFQYSVRNVSQRNAAAEPPVLQLRKRPGLNNNNNNNNNNNTTIYKAP